MSTVLPKPKIVHDPDGRPVEVVIPIEAWRAIEVALGDEDADDIAAVTAARAEDNAFASAVAVERGRPVETSTPLDVVKAKLDGVHPVKAWRDHRRKTQLWLSEQSGVGRALIAKIETGEREGSIETLDHLARALDVPIEGLIARKAGMSIYDPLRDCLLRRQSDEFELTFADIEAQLGFSLPKSAERPQWWENTRGPSRHPQRKAWGDAGYDAFLIGGSRRVKFRRSTN
jgi:transcriptional regulator with XRE-family HTH domain